MIRSTDQIPERGIQSILDQQMASQPSTRAVILDAAKSALLAYGYSALSTRGIAEMAGVPLSQIHYHFGSKQDLMLEVLEEENRRLLERQTDLYQADIPLWRQWEQACDFLDDDLASGYVRVLQEMMATGWADDEIAEAVKVNIRGWLSLLTDTAKRASDQLNGLGPFSPEQIAALVGSAFLGAESMILLGFEEEEVPMRSALRNIGEVIKAMEESP